MSFLCPRPAAAKKSDDGPRAAGGAGGSNGGGGSTVSSGSLLIAIAASLTILGGYSAWRGRLGVGGRGGGGSSGGECAPLADGTLVIHPRRALAQLNISHWQFRNITQTTFPDGHPVRHYESSQSNVWEMARKQWWESETFRIGSTIIRDARRVNATVLDIGGWIGITGLFYSTLAPRVIALEPDMAARSELVANVALNPLLEPRIRIYDKCISDKREKVLMKGDPGGSWSSTKFFDDKKLPAWEVDCMPLEDFLKIANVEVKDIIFIKIDIEGSEAYVLPALRKWLKAAGRPPIWLSLHKWLWPKGGETPKALATVFRDYPHVFDARLQELPRSKINADLFGEGSDSAYLLTSKVYNFAELTVHDFNNQGGALALPAEPKKKRKRVSRPEPVEEEEEEEAPSGETDDPAAEEDGGDDAGASGSTRGGRARRGGGDEEEGDGGADDDGSGDAEEEEPEPAPRRRGRGRKM